MLKGLIGTLVGVTLGGEVMGRIGSTPSIPSGIRDATQSLVGVGILSNAAGLIKWK